jgi:hypothetical protein
MNTTRKKIKGGSLGFSNYTPQEIYTAMNNYLAAAYAIKNAANSLKNTVTSKTTDSYKTQTDNASQFNIILGLYSQYVTRLKNNFLHITPPPSSIPLINAQPAPLPAPKPAPAPAPLPAPKPAPAPAPLPAPKPAPASIYQPAPAPM